MSYDEFPMPRPMLFVKETEGWLIDPQMIPFALTTPPYTPMSSSETCYRDARPDEPRKPPPVVQTARALRLRRFRAVLQSLRLIRPLTPQKP
jgi:hypothetical protein